MAKSSVTAVTKYFPTVNEGFQTTVASPGVTSGGANVPLASTAGLVDGSVFVGVVEPGLTNQQVFTGDVDVTNAKIANVKWTRGSNVSHATGTTVVDWDTGTAMQMISAGVKKEHNDNGTHAAVTATSVSTTGSVTAGNNLTVSAGTVTMPTASLPSRVLTPTYIFRATRNATANSTPSAWNPMIFTTAEFNIGGCYSTSTGRFTAAISGYYQFSTSVQNDSGWANILVGFHKNGSDYSWGTRYENASGTAAGNFTQGAVLHHSDVVHLAAGEYLEVKYWADDGDLYGGPDPVANFFSGFLVAAG